MRSDPEVLVVGAGPVGLAAAIELGTRGVKVLLVDQAPRAGAAPRAKTTNVRTRSLLRRWGLADRLAQASPLGVDYPNDVIFVTRLSGYKLAHFPNAFNGYMEKDDAYPEHAQWVPQYTLERVMREFAETLPSVEIRFGAGFVTANQDAAGLTAELKAANGESSVVGAKFLIGADGARSAVREVIGAKMQGHYGLSRNYNIVFRAPGLAQAHPHDPAIMYWQINSDGASLIGPMDRDDIWFFMPTGIREGQVLSNDEAAAAITQATGIALRYEILSADEWVASQLLADHYRERRIFLAGDACHLHPPFGGYGMNMGIADGVDLGWKLAAVLQGWGGPPLLDSYEAERRPIHATVMEEAVANHAVLGGQLWRESLEDDTAEGIFTRKTVGDQILLAKAREFKTLGTVLGLAYHNSPVITADEGRAQESRGTVYTPSAAPGRLTPHSWLSDGLSLYDLFGPGFSLLVDVRVEQREVAEAVADAKALAVPLKVIRLEDVSLSDRYGATLILVRPDQHVAWRGDHWNPTALARAAGLLDCVPAAQ